MEHSPKQNFLLAALPAWDVETLLRDMEHVPMPLGLSVYEAGRPQDHVYFPTTSIVSLLYVTKAGESAEIAVVGRDGMAGVSAIMGGNTTPSRAAVQSAGHAYRLSTPALKAEFDRGSAMQHILLRYMQALMTQMMQTAVCYRHHSLEQQLCRWLLLSLDRVATNQLDMTAELIANMLGVQRHGVAEATDRFQELGLIRYERGRITVLDRPKMEARVCECYAVVKQETDRLFPAGIF